MNYTVEKVETMLGANSVSNRLRPQIKGGPFQSKLESEFRKVTHQSNKLPLAAGKPSLETPCLYQMEKTITLMK